MEKMERIVISCMDRRLNEYLDSINDGKTVFVRNAGANVRPLRRTLGELLDGKQIIKILIIPHTDCGAMGAVYNALIKDEKFSSDITVQLIDPFRALDFSKRERLEELNEGFEVAVARAMIPTVSVESELINIEDLNLPKSGGTHRLIVTSPSGMRYDLINKCAGTDPHDTYVLQASLTEVHHDIELAVTALHMKEIIFLAQTRTDESLMKSRISALAEEPFIRVNKVRLSFARTYKNGEPKQRLKA